MNSLYSKKASGFTLIELLISLILGLLILGAVGAVYIGSKRTYSERDTLSLVQENGRIAIQLLEYGISPAGYPAVDNFDPFIHNATIDNVQSQLIDGQPKQFEADRIGIKFFPASVGAQDGYSRDCLGSDKKSGEFVENSFSIEGGKLYCKGSSNANRQPIAEGVQSMKIQYGVLNTTVTPEIIELFNATTLNDKDTWEQVISVKIELGIETPKETDYCKQHPETEPCKARIFSTTIPLRNRIPLPEQVP